MYGPMHNLSAVVRTRPQSHMATHIGMVVACLLIAIRIVAGFVCHTCFFDIEQPKTRSFHLHTGSDLNPCHHGRVETGPLVNWACAVTQDESAFILPEIPRLPVVASLFVPHVLLLVSHTDRPLVTAHGRGPPHFIT